MQTIEQVSENINNLLSAWGKDFEPLYLAVSTTREAMAERIFEDGYNSSGKKLPDPGYSTKEAYFDVVSLPSVPAAFQIGKRGTKIKSAYFPGGYRELKNNLQGQGALELNNRLKIAFSNVQDNPQIEDGLTCAIALPDEEAGKREGLEIKYGLIFQMTQEEEELFIRTHEFEIADSINNALSQ